MESNMFFFVAHMEHEKKSLGYSETPNLETMKTFQVSSGEYTCPKKYGAWKT